MQIFIVWKQSYVSNQVQKVLNIEDMTNKTYILSDKNDDTTLTKIKKIYIIWLFKNRQEFIKKSY